ncbi:hypothetical protein [Lactovum odontotermitis]
MLTARQQKFYVRIGLLAASTDITEMERKNLERAKKWLDRDDSFRVVYDSLGLGLKSLEAERLQGKLTPTVKKLLEDLIEVYGEPEKSRIDISVSIMTDGGFV